MRNEILIIIFLIVLGAIFVSQCFDENQINFKDDIVSNNDSVGWRDNPNDTYWDNSPYMTIQSFHSKTNQSYANITVEYKYYDGYGNYIGGENVTVDFAEEGDIESVSAANLTRRPKSFTAEVIEATPVED